MPESPGNIEEIHSSLKATLGQGRSDLDQDVVAASKRVLLQNITFQPASAPYAMQRDALRAKYISLNPTPIDGKGKTSGEASQQTSGKPAHNPASVEKNGEGLPIPRVVIYPEDKVKMEWTRMTRIGAGLVNMGNTCFFNSTLQCLTYTAPLVNYCFTNDHRDKCAKKDFCMMCEIQSHIKNSLVCGGRSIKPHSILQKLRCIAKHMKWGRQEDAHEFLRFVVDHLQQSCLNGETKLDRFSKETTVINQIFGGYLRSQVTCLRCHAKSNTFDPFMDLSLDIKGVNTVEDALAKYVKPETLEQENAYKCPKCKNKVRAEKRFLIQKPPNVLTLQLNRFDFNRHLSGKINRFIKYPEKINLRRYMSQNQGEPVLYHLYGVLVHSGHSSEHGHYYSYVKSPSKTWYCMNDSIVHQASAHNVFAADAYVLFYARINKSSGSSNGPSPASNSLNHVKTPSSPVKGGFIGPVLPNHMKQESIPMLNGIHGKPSSEVGTPVKRQMGSSPVHTNGTNNGGQHNTGTALPSLHNKISFTLLNSQQKKQQLMQQQQKEDGKRIVLQIKHGNSTTMEKSPDGKSKVVNGGVGTQRLGGLVPYNDDSDSEQENQGGVGESHSQSSSKTQSGGTKLVTASISSAGDYQRSLPGASKSSYPLPRADGDAKDSERTKSGPGFQTHHTSSSGSSLARNSQAAIVKAHPHVMSTSSTAQDHPYTPAVRHISLLHPPPRVADSGQSGTAVSEYPRPAPSASTLPSASGASGKAGLVDLELPVVNVSSCAESYSTKVKATAGNWLIHSQESAGLPSPRGSCSSTNSVNSTTEWTVHSKDVCSSVKTNHEQSQEVESGNKVKVIARGSTLTNERLTANTNTHSDSSNGWQSKLKDKQWTKLSHAESKEDSPVRASMKLSQAVEASGSRTPVDISDRRPLLSNSSSATSDNGTRKFKKHKKKHRKDSDNVEYKELRDDSSSRSDSSSRKKKKHKHKKDKQEKKRHKEKEYSNSDDSDSDSYTRERRKKRKHAHYDSDSSVSSQEERHKHKRLKEEVESDGYEWVEKTIESTAASDLAKKQNHRVSVQSWNHHVKDDVAPRRDAGQDRVKSTWDGMRTPKVSDSLEGTSYSFGSRVLSWDGSKNHNDREVDEEERRKKKKHWSDEYNQDIDSGKVKKVKRKDRDDDGFSSSNPFQHYQSNKIRDQDSRSSWPSWSQDHSYHQHHHDHHYHKKASSSQQQWGNSSHSKHNHDRQKGHANRWYNNSSYYH